MMYLDCQVKRLLPAQFVRQNRSSWFRSRTSFFSSILNTDIPITLEYYEIIESVLFGFFHNGLTYEDILGIQIFLRASIKTEFMFTEFITPIEFMNLYNIAQKIEQKKIDDLENEKRGHYNK